MIKLLVINPNFPTVTCSVPKNRIKMGILRHRFLSARLPEGAVDDFVIFHGFLQVSQSTIIV